MAATEEADVVVTVRPARAFGRTGWRETVTDPELVEAFAALEERLVTETRTPPREARAAINHLVHFCRLCQDPERWPPDKPPVHPQSLSGCAPDMRRAHDVWLSMLEHAHWRPAYLREVRTNLSRVLLLIAEPLAHVVNPRLYKGASGLAEYEVRRSQETRFLLHECLPWRVRCLPPGSVEYRLLCRIGERMAECLQSVSRNHLRSILVLFDHLLHDDPPLWPAEDDTHTHLDARWAYLSEMSAADWLRRYETVMRPRPNENDRRIGLELWKRHLRFISHFHSRVLHPDTPLYIPVPQCAALVSSVRATPPASGGGGGGECGEDGWWSTSSFASSAGGPLSDDEEAPGASGGGCVKAHAPPTPRPRPTATDERCSTCWRGCDSACVDRRPRRNAGGWRTVCSPSPPRRYDSSSPAPAPRWNSSLSCFF